MTNNDRQPVLILGAGVNGCSLARELLLNGVSVWLVDTGDIGCGATAKSSRLIHGGLRYLEYGDFRLVRESLDERRRLLKLAPQFVWPLRLSIPVERRLGGWINSIFRFLGATRVFPLNRLAPLLRQSSERGLWLVRMGLWFYDLLARNGDDERHTVCSTTDPSAPGIDPDRYRWACTYTDAQMRAPERFVIALLEDARRLAVEKTLDFHVCTYHRATFSGQHVEIRRCDDDMVAADIQPVVIVNATGAWGDATLEQLAVPSKRLFGGTKGSHFVTGNPQLRQAIGDGGVYVEAGDGRMVFVLPFGDDVLVGTTDERFNESPDRAFATDAELDYLIGMVNEVFDKMELTRGDVIMHYSGVRPLPFAATGSSGSISRGHSIETHENGHPPVYTLVGGKLTTARAFAEDVADRIFKRIGRIRTTDSRERVVPGGEKFPEERSAVHAEYGRLATVRRLDVELVRSIWQNWGTRTESILKELGALSGENLTGTHFPIEYVRWTIENEWVSTLDDLVERRLMLVYSSNLSRAALREIAECLVESGRLDAADIDDAVRATVQRLEEFYGRGVER